MVRLGLLETWGDELYELPGIELTMCLSYNSALNGIFVFFFFPKNNERCGETLSIVVGHILFANLSIQFYYGSSIQYWSL